MVRSGRRQGAEPCSSKGSVLVAFDAPLGVPESYLAAAQQVQSWKSPKTFLELLACASSTPQFFDATLSPDDWKIERPFFSVPEGQGGLTKYQDSARRMRVDLYRAIDERTKAKTVFAKSGIPGSVGSAACDLWQNLGALLREIRNFKIWPFEGDLELLLRELSVVIGEIYPRAAYATDLLDMPVEKRPPLAIAKTHEPVREAAIEALLSTRWVRELRVSIKTFSKQQPTKTISMPA
jgi:hypothetical protein